MNAPASEPRGGAAETPRARPRLGDWRVWLGLGVTAVALYWTLHDVALGEFLGALSRANSWLILAMLPFHVIVLWLRAIRWRYLSQSIAPAPLPLGALFRATAVETRASS